MVIHSTPYKNSIPTRIKTKNPSPGANPSKKVLPIASSNKLDSATSSSLPKSLPYLTLSLPIILMKSLKKMLPLLNKFIKKRMSLARSKEKMICLKIPPIGSKNLKSTRFKKNNLNNFLMAHRARNLNFTSSTETSWLNLMKKILKGNFLIKKIFDQNSL